MKGFESSELCINSINVPFAKEAECSPGRSAVSFFSKLLGDLKSLEIDGYCIEDGCRVGVHILLQYPMFGFKPVAKQETRMTTSCCRIVRVQSFFLVQSPSFGMEVMKESRKKDCGVRSVFWFMENTEPICYQQENCRENDWLGDLPSFELANDEPQLSAKHCSQLAAYFGHTLGCRILSSFTLTHFTLTFKSE